jgi:hypothetical protein
MRIIHRKSVILIGLSLFTFLMIPTPVAGSDDNTQKSPSMGGSGLSDQEQESPSMGGTGHSDQEQDSPSVNKFLLGDVNHDGYITMADANMVVNYFLATNKPEDFDVKAADVNGDGSITMADANQIVNMFLGSAQ